MSGRRILSFLATRAVTVQALAERIWNARWIFAQMFTNMSDFIAVRQAFEGIKARLEGAPLRARFLYVELFRARLAMFFGFVAALVGMVLRRRWFRLFLLAIVAGMLTVVCALARPLLIDFLGFAAIVAGLWIAYRTPRRPVEGSSGAEA